MLQTPVKNGVQLLDGHKSVFVLAALRYDVLFGLPKAIDRFSGQVWCMGPVGGETLLVLGVGLTPKQIHRDLALS